VAAVGAIACADRIYRTGQVAGTTSYRALTISTLNPAVCCGSALNDFVV